MGNLHSVLRKFKRIGAAPVVISDPGEVVRADKLVLPGVGHFRAAMQNLEESGLRGPLVEAVMERGVPILGICLGMQLFATHSEEGDAAGLGWIDASVVRFAVSDPLRFKVPQIGWNSMEAKKNSELTKGLLAEAEYYFIHAYHMVCNDQSDILGETNYAYPFTSAIERENIFGVQFHPEKSHDAGEAMLKNFVSL